MALVLVAFLAEPVEPDPIEVSPALVWGLALACVLGAVVLGLAVRRVGGRRRSLQHLASTEHLVYSDADPAGISSLQFPTFASARGVLVRDVLTLRAGSQDVRAFDFALWDERDRRSDRRTPIAGLADEVFGFDARPAAETQRSYSGARSGAVVRVDAFLPPCTITPVSWASRTFEAIGVADLDFESEAFNRGWDVRCVDRRFASLFVDAQLIDLLLSLDERVGLETLGNYVLFSARLLRPRRQVQLLRAAARLPDILAPLVRHEYPNALAMHTQTAEREWSRRPDGHGGYY